MPELAPNKPKISFYFICCEKYGWFQEIPEYCPFCARFISDKFEIKANIEKSALEIWKK